MEADLLESERENLAVDEPQLNEEPGPSQEYPETKCTESEPVSSSLEVTIKNVKEEPVDTEEENEELTNSFPEFEFVNVDDTAIKDGETSCVVKMEKADSDITPEALSPGTVFGNSDEEALSDAAVLAATSCEVKMEICDSDPDADSEEISSEFLDSQSQEKLQYDAAVVSSGHSLISTGGQHESFAEPPVYPETGDIRIGMLKNSGFVLSSEHLRPLSISKCTESKSHKSALKEELFKDTIRCNEAATAKSTDLVHSNERPFKCSICEKTFRRSYHVQRHMLSHTGERAFKCSLCGKAFTHNSHLTQHMRTHTGEKPYKCNQCDKVFSQSSILASHMHVHVNEKPYKCSQCDKAFSLNYTLTVHMRIHTGEKPYKCSQCDKAFAESGTLTAHMRIHTGEKPYKCKHCSKAFSYRGTYTAHMRIHTGEKPYKCSECDKAFSDSSTLSAHKRIHTGEKPYKCSQCNKAFTDSSTLSAHKRVHTGEKPFTCKQCNNAFKRKGDLTKHMRLHENKAP